MMTETHEPRLFSSDAEIHHIGEGLVGYTLTRAEWTHEAHLAACTWVLTERPDIVAERDLPDIIRCFNVSVGGVNDETQGYHETITQCFIRGVRLYLAGTTEQSLVARVNGLLLSPQGRRDWPLRFYSSKRLFSVKARLGFVERDKEPLPEPLTGGQEEELESKFGS